MKKKHHKAEEIIKKLGEIEKMQICEIGSGYRSAAPEGAACAVAVRKMLEARQVGADERIVLFNTGSGVKYLEFFQ